MKGKGWTLHVGDVQKVCARLIEQGQGRTFDAVLCDPPYDLTAGKNGGTGDASVDLSTPYGRARITAGGGFMGQAWDATGIAFDKQTWALVAKLLRPGAHLLAAGGTRTFHRMACAVEDAGFEIRDCIAWIQGQGFPKSANIGKALDAKAGAKRKVIATLRIKSGGTESLNRANANVHGYRPDGYQKGENVLDVTAPATHAARTWEGYGSALKPSWEGWTLARKPLRGTLAHNAHVHGVGALAIDASRIKHVNASDFEKHAKHVEAIKKRGGIMDNSWANKSDLRGASDVTAAGRWPGNVILDEAAASELDAQSGLSASRSGKPRKGRSGAGWGMSATGAEYNDAGGASRFFYCPKVGPGERNAGLDEEPALGPLDGRKHGSAGTRSPRAGANRNGGSKNPHPTLKPIALTTYLARLLLPPPGARSKDKPRRILVPFAGAGSEMIGCLLAGWDEVVGIELSKEYAAIASKRIAHHVRLSEPSKGALYEALKQKGKKP